MLTSSPVWAYHELFVWLPYFLWPEMCWYYWIKLKYWVLWWVLVLYWVSQLMLLMLILRLYWVKHWVINYLRGCYYLVSADLVVNWNYWKE